MNFKSRFIFHANAAAIGGRIVKPKDIILETEATSSLAASGGRSRSSVESGNFGDLVRFGTASTLVEGLFDDPKQWSEVLCGDRFEDTLTASTRASAELTDLSVSATAPFSARRIRGVLSATSARAGGEPAIKVGDETVIEGAALGPYKLTIELNTKLFQQYDTLAQLRTAADDPKFVRANGSHLFLTTEVSGRTAASPVGRLVETGGLVYGTIVKSIRWSGKPYPGAEIDRHVITIPNCGQIFFGEILISSMSRRLTMVRLHLCCPFAGVMMCCDTEDNGSWAF